MALVIILLVMATLTLVEFDHLIKEDIIIIPPVITGMGFIKGQRMDIRPVLSMDIISHK